MKNKPIYFKLIEIEKLNHAKEELIEKSHKKRGRNPEKENKTVSH